MESMVVFVAYSNWQKVIRAQNSIKILFPVKLELHEGGRLQRAFLLWLMEVYTQFFLLCTILMQMFEDMLKVYTGPAAIFSNVSLQKRYFHKFYYFSDRVYFQ